MRTMKLIGFCLAACFQVSVLAASTAPVLGERALREECSAFSQAGMRDCLAKKAESSREALRQAEEKVASLTAENDRLADEIARLRALLNPDAAQARAETEQQMEDLRTALLSLLDQPTGSNLH